MMNRTRLFTDKNNAKRFVARLHKDGKAAELKEEKWNRQGTQRIEYRVNYEA